MYCTHHVCLYTREGQLPKPKTRLVYIVSQNDFRYCHLSKHFSSSIYYPVQDITKTNIITKMVSP